MNYDNLIFAQLIEEDLIPEKGTFLVTDIISNRYVELYSLFKGEGNLGSKANKRYATKLAGLSFLKLNEKRLKNSTEYSKTLSGVVYLISNPAFPGYLKIGITGNLLKRISSYQTYDPLRRYKIEHYKIVSNARQYEKYLLNNSKIDLAKGEWVLDKNIRELFISD
jgi:hypothetical protein